LNASAGTIAVEAFIPPEVDGAAGNYYLDASDGTTANRITFVELTGSIGQIAASGSTTFNQTIGGEPTAPTRLAIAYQANNSNMAVSGTLGTLDTSVTIPTVNRLDIGGRGDGANTTKANGWTRSFAYYNTRLPDAILKQKSTVGAPY